MRPDFLPFGRPALGSREIDAVARVMRSGWVGAGPETAAFERELASYVDAPHVVTLNSCTSALFLSLLVQGVGPGTEVVCPSLTWCSTADAALYLGAQPVLCDVDPHTLCVTPETVVAALGPRTRAVVVVHFGGRAVDVEGLRVALPEDVAIVEDAAHAFGARFPSGARVGASGNPTCFSFYANKNLSTAEGGAIALREPRVASRLRALRQHGLPHNAWERLVQGESLPTAEVATELGYKMNYTDLQAAIGRVQLSRQEEFASRRLAIARHYAAFLEALDPEIETQAGVCTAGHARHLFVVLLPSEKLRMDRDRIAAELKRRNIGVAVHYPPLHRSSRYRTAGGRDGLPATDALASRLLTLPLGAGMSLEDAADVTEAFGEVYREALARWVAE